MLKNRSFILGLLCGLFVAILAVFIARVSGEPLVGRAMAEEYVPPPQPLALSATTEIYGGWIEGEYDFSLNTVGDKDTGEFKIWSFKNPDESIEHRVSYSVGHGQQTDTVVFEFSEEKLNEMLDMLDGMKEYWNAPYQPEGSQ